MVNLHEAVSVAPLEMTGKKWRVKVIEGDKQGSSAYYPKDILERDIDKFQGRAKIYMNHPSEDDKANRPERNAQDIIGYVEHGVYEGKDVFSEAHVFSDWKEWVKERAEAGVIGLSIRASGEVDESGTLTAFHQIHSVDLVTEAGAGGEFISVLESARKSVSASESVAESKKKEESVMDPKMEAALDALVESSQATAAAVALLTERAAAEDAAKALLEAEAAEKEAPKAPSFSEIDAALNEAELPASARASVLKAVEGGADLKESVAAKKAEVDALLEEAGSSFRGNVDNEKKGKSLEESIATNLAAAYGI